MALFTQISQEMSDALHHSGFPGLNRYHLEDLDGGHTAMMIFHGDGLLQGLLLDNKKVNLGVLLSVAVPRMLELVAKARG